MNLVSVFSCVLCGDTVSGKGVLFLFLFFSQTQATLSSKHIIQKTQSCFLFFLLSADMGFLLCCSISLLKMRVLLGAAFSVDICFSGALLIPFV